ncbi:MAG: Lrp/AsnC family transcriptional regulator [Chloroflexi bacterium]|jgi:Lrp/AsnC family transcriptional regulator, regulator for asnA, asnC and gidA|nr:Lrp/AsnC family transcriptional regulator [Chloroflexota bacterium]
MVTSSNSNLKTRQPLDELHLLLIAELEGNARQTITELAYKLRTNRNTLREKFEQLLDSNIIRIVAIPHIMHRGYRMRIYMGINTQPGKIDSVANSIASHRSVQLVGIFTGRYDVVAAAILDKPENLSGFIQRDLAMIDGITRVETMINLELVKVSYAFLSDQNYFWDMNPPRQPLDQLDLRLIEEVRRDALQTQHQLARTLGVNISTVGRRLQHLMDENMIRIVAVPDPLALGFQTQAMIGINIEPGRVGAIASELAALRCVHHVLINTGQFDLIVWVGFKDDQELSAFVRERLGQIPGLLKYETMMRLRMVKD